MLFGLMLVLPLAAESRQGLVFGSYLNAEFAETRAREVAAALGGDVQIVPTGVAGALRYRVVRLVAPAQLAAVKAQAKQDGLGEAWSTSVGTAPGAAHIVGGNRAAVPCR